METIAAAVMHRDAISALTTAADTLTIERPLTIEYGSNCVLGPSKLQEVLVGSCTALESPQGTILAADPSYEPVVMQVYDHFVAQHRTRLPRYGWAVMPTAENDMQLLQEKLANHGITYVELKQPMHVGEAAKFFVQNVNIIQARTAHGVAPDGIQLDGHWKPEASTVVLPIGAVVVSGEQRLLRLAAQLLEPVSNDGLFTCEVLGVEAAGAAASEHSCPVLQLISPPMLIPKPRL